MPKPIEHHTLILDDAGDYQREHYGVTHKSRFVYGTTKISYSATRLQVWDNTGRPNPYRGHKQGDTVKPWPLAPAQVLTEWFIISKTQFHANPLTAKWFDPQNEPTDEPVSLLLSPESTAICADTRYNTGQPGSGQVFGPGKLGDNDTATLVYPDGTEREITLHFPPHRNGHGYATFDK